MKIVKFKDGKFGIRRFFLFYGWEYLDLVSFPQRRFWWGAGDSNYPDTHGTEERARTTFEEIKDHGTPV